MSDFWCRRCWRENATDETRRLYPASGDAPKNGWFPVHCWARFYGVDCIMQPNPQVNAWLFTFTQNLMFGAGLCAAFNQGYDESERPHPGWWPGCALDRPAFEFRSDEL